MKRQGQLLNQPIGYAADTLINGNITHCIEYLKHLNYFNMATWVYEELDLIKRRCPEKLQYVLKKVGNRTNSTLNNTLE